jgi:hypothetical protein
VNAVNFTKIPFRQEHNGVIPGTEVQVEFWISDTAAEPVLTNQKHRYKSEAARRFRNIREFVPRFNQDYNNKKI